jgi:hypothetical protein
VAEPKKKPDPLAHLKKATRVKHPDQKRRQDLPDRKRKGLAISKAKKKV